jgi:hypothetical protein
MLLVVPALAGCGYSTWLGYQYYWAGTCVVSLVIVIITTLFVIFFNVVALLPLCNVNVFRKNATIFTVSLASIYIVYLTWSAMASNYDESCQLNMNDSTNTILQIVFGLIFSFVTIISIALATAERKAGAEKTITDDII